MTKTTSTMTPKNGAGKKMKKAPPQKAKLKKLKYDYVALCDPPNCEDHGRVYFVDGPMENVSSFENLNRICELMDEESAHRLRTDVAILQSRGKLHSLLSLEALRQMAERQAQEKRDAAEEKKRQAEREEQKRQREARCLEIERMLTDLRKKKEGARMAGISPHVLARTVTDKMMQTLEMLDKEEKGLSSVSVISEMARRDMVIHISVVADVDSDDPNLAEGHVVLDLVINPRDLIGKDVSKNLDELETSARKLNGEFLGLFYGPNETTP